jgi:acetyl-CoA/propionyl-CoA carboxylase, biotin carboxylase, biotin carboxyl carrier protein
MEQPLTAHRSGIVKNLSAQVGATVTNGSTLCEIVD